MLPSFFCYILHLIRKKNIDRAKSLRYNNTVMKRCYETAFHNNNQHQYSRKEKIKPDTEKLWQNRSKVYTSAF